MQRMWWLFILAVICLSFLSLLYYYSDAFLPCWPDEAIFIQPAQNFAQGKGMGTPALDDLLPNIDKRTYWQPPLYFLTLSVWGEIFGFDILSARWFSRLLGVLGLLLLFLLLRQWGLPLGLSILCVFLTTVDLDYQRNANVARMDMLNLVLLLASILTFTDGMKRQNDLAFLISGIFGTLSVLTHLISAPVVFFLFMILLVRRLKKQALWFLLPLLLGLLGWLIYALQDWESFIGQMALQFQRKSERGFLERFLLVFSMKRLMIVWLVMLLATAIAFKFRRSPMMVWQAFIIGFSYLSTVFGQEMWYIGWFVPFGYLMTVFWLNASLRIPTMRIVLLVAVLLWSVNRFAIIWKVLQEIPIAKSDTSLLIKDLSQLLPPKSTVIVYSIPDPYLPLSQNRPDLKLFQLSPTPMQFEALQRLKRKADFFLGLWELGEPSGVLSGAPQPQFRSWTIRSTLSPFPLRIWLVPLSKIQH
ncbi:MAG: glycosyltransferase family 39 protein [Armatimonadetes bacterium]|nr:glycosyltransferase family 39 protein [Armatimonadota bacterium]